MVLVPTAVSCAKEGDKNSAIYSPKENKTQKTTDATDVLNKKKNASICSRHQSSTIFKKPKRYSFHWDLVCKINILKIMYKANMSETRTQTAEKIILVIP